MGNRADMVCFHWSCVYSQNRVDVLDVLKSWWTAKRVTAMKAMIVHPDVDVLALVRNDCLLPSFGRKPGRDKQEWHEWLAWHEFAKTHLLADTTWKGADLGVLKQALRVAFVFSVEVLARDGEDVEFVRSCLRADRVCTAAVVTPSKRNRSMLEFFATTVVHSALVPAPISEATLEYGMFNRAVTNLCRWWLPIVNTGAEGAMPIAAALHQIKLVLDHWLEGSAPRKPPREVLQLAVRLFVQTRTLKRCGYAVGDINWCGTSWRLVHQARPRWCIEIWRNPMLFDYYLTVPDKDRAEAVCDFFAMSRDVSEKKGFLAGWRIFGEETRFVHRVADPNVFHAENEAAWKSMIDTATVATTSVKDLFAPGQSFWRSAKRHLRSGRLASMLHTLYEYAPDAPGRVDAEAGVKVRVTCGRKRAREEDEDEDEDGSENGVDVYIRA